ncbi:glycosyltransferase [Sphingobacterium sp. xlx-130]|uniref:glycosyltransferase n=1 Tax=Sphingobacterium sp. xlx-130 TaxID=2654323 RepID=UPI0013D8E131|nr:glycosyltransferase [Sphingobacterium sp. xlx-130]
MILIDGIFVNNGGGKILLDYLVGELEKTNLEVYYLIDSRLSSSYSVKKTNLIEYLDADLLKRNLFYRKKGSLFSKVLILGNVPPLVRLNAKVFTYFHNTIYLGIPKEFSLIEKIRYFFKIFIIKWYKRNTDIWLVQTESVRDRLRTDFGNKTDVLVMPFYPSYSNEMHQEKIKDTFLYVSNAQPNKNHFRLLEAFRKSYDKMNRGRLIVTVNENFKDIIRDIQESQMRGYPIDNLGFVKREDLKAVYEKSEFVIYPSLSESFGLGIVEGIEFRCKVIASDLDYTFAVCEPSKVFNPRDIDSIEKAISDAFREVLPESKLLVSDKVIDLINLLR